MTTDIIAYYWPAFSVVSLDECTEVWASDRASRRYRSSWHVYLPMIDRVFRYYPN